MKTIRKGYRVGNPRLLTGTRSRRKRGSSGGRTLFRIVTEYATRILEFPRGGWVVERLFSTRGNIEPDDARDSGMANNYLGENI